MFNKLDKSKHLSTLVETSEIEINFPIEATRSEQGNQIGRFIPLWCRILMIMRNDVIHIYVFYYCTTINWDEKCCFLSKFSIWQYSPLLHLCSLHFLTDNVSYCRYKAWGSLLGQQLSERDVLVACIDYRSAFNLINITILTKMETGGHHAKHFLFIGVGLLVFYFLSCLHIHSHLKILTIIFRNDVILPKRF